MIDNILIPVLERDDVVVRDDLIKEGLRLEKYLPFKLLDWEIFLFAVIAGIRYRDGDIYFNKIWILVGRGSGKNGFIDFLCLYFLSPYHGVKEYNIDLLANSENQVKTSFMDVYDFIKNPVKEEYKRVLKQNYRVTLETITGTETNSTLRFNTSSKRGKDSKRTGCIIYDEKHEFLDHYNMNTLESGMGKIPFGRVITITTDGHIREGVLDREKDKNQEILKEYDPDNQTFVFWCRIEKEEEWKDINKLVKAIPSLEDFPTLKRTIKNEIKDMPAKMEYFPEFMAKRCNFPIGDIEIQVAERKDIEATNRPVPDLTGMSCVGGIDYANTNDFVACVLLFKKGGFLYVLHHSFICKSSRDLPGIKAPLKEWEERGDCEFVDGPVIPPELPAGWFDRQGEKYNILKIAIDNFRHTLLKAALENIGFTAAKGRNRDEGNVFLTHKWEIIAAAPVINNLFVTQTLVFGDVPMMRWYTNNTKKVVINGNVSYAKIEEHYRKTDGFMAFAAGMTLYEEIPEDVEEIIDLEVYSY